MIYHLLHGYNYMNLNPVNAQRVASSDFNDPFKAV